MKKSGAAEKLDFQRRIHTETVTDFFRSFANVQYDALPKVCSSLSTVAAAVILELLIDLRTDSRSQKGKGGFGRLRSQRRQEWGDGGSGCSSAERCNRPPLTQADTSLSGDSMGERATSTAPTST